MRLDLGALRARLWESEGRGGTGAVLLSWVRVVVIAVAKFSADKGQLRASTLTFFTLLSIVPLLATIFGIAKGFGLQQLVRRLIESRVEWQQSVIEVLLRFSSAALRQASGGIIAGVGVMILFLSIVAMIGAVEQAFNTVWNVRAPRGMVRRLADYLSIVVIGTVLLSISSGVSVFITAQVQFAAQKISFFQPVSNTLLKTLHVIPLAINWILFAFLYLFIPNTRVPFRSGMVAGLVAGSLFQLVQWAYITFQIGVAGYGAVYGSFAALPLFLVWLRTAWTIILFGSELSFAIANNRTYGFFPDFRGTSCFLRKAIAAAIYGEIERAFMPGGRPPGADEICRSLRIPRQFFFPLIDKLTDAGLVSEVKRRDALPGYQPAVPPERVTLAEVLSTLEFEGESSVPVSVSDRVKTCYDAVGSLWRGCFSGSRPGGK